MLERTTSAEVRLLSNKALSEVSGAASKSCNVLGLFLRVLVRATHLVCTAQAEKHGGWNTTHQVYVVADRGAFGGSFGCEDCSMLFKITGLPRVGGDGLENLHSRT